MTHTFLHFPIQISPTIDSSGISGSFWTYEPISHILSTVHSLPLVAVHFSQVANMTSMTNVSNTNDINNTFLKILLAVNILLSEDYEISWKHTQD